MIKIISIALALTLAYLAGYNQGNNRGYETALKFNPNCNGGK